MSNQTKAGTQNFDSFSDTIDLRVRQEQKTDPQGIGTSTDELTLGGLTHGSNKRLTQSSDEWKKYVIC